jgi:drug/metabolite transporter (DMT)-like permease
VIVGFPLLSAMALRQVPASHATVVFAIAPLATALVAALRAGERPGAPFWLASALGGGAVLWFMTSAGAGTWQAADTWLLVAVLVVAVGYAEGARLARELGGMGVVCWALVLSLPVLIVPVAHAALTDGLTAGAPAWLGFAYSALISMFLAFMAWYAGLARGGIARISQVQLLQPCLTLLWAALLLGEAIETRQLVGAGLVLVSVVLCQMARMPARVPARMPARVPARMPARMPAGGPARLPATAGAPAAAAAPVAAPALSMPRALPVPGRERER